MTTYGRGVRELAANLFEQGFGDCVAACRLKAQVAYPKNR